MQEERRSSSSWFITLTYDTDFVPITKRGFMTINKRDCQLFLKRLRKANKAKKIKYYLAAEYGTKFMRPHYHVIMFNVDVNTVTSAWGNGSCYFGSVTGASVGYTLKYMSKEKQVPKHRNDDRMPEFSLMSKGLGKAYLSDAMVAWHKADLDERMYCNLFDGRKIAMPRYYKDKIYTEQERKRVAFFQRIKMVAEQEKEIQEHADDWLYWHNKAEKDLYDFKVMRQKAKEGLTI